MYTPIPLHQHLRSVLLTNYLKLTTFTGNRYIFYSYSRSFQYKIPNNVLCLNKRLFTFRKWTSFLCPFCKLSDETMLHLFYEYNIIQKLWNDLALFFESDFTLFDLIPQTVFLGFLNVESKPLLLQNHLLLIFKIYIYNSRRSESLILKSLIKRKHESLRYTNADLKISLYARLHIKTMPWKFLILKRTNSRVFTREVCIFLKK